ncbi:MAG: glycosyltransferase [Candidatus Heimdallarchaeota archaeon]|nr:glycosyltransferase [Candidatus Heimdallarchaeota archaeon]MBY8993315.1 glycosyltransferase [Candidatus Heimdallarchaeota archaeon]
MGKKILADKTLLIITPYYPDEKNKDVQGIFVKDQINEIKKHFKKIYVIAFVLNSLKISKKNRLYKNYSYDNVSVFYLRSLYFPLEFSGGIRIDNRHTKLLRFIKKKDLKFDLVHAHFSWPSGFIASKIKDQLNIPYILTVHENFTWFKSELKNDYKEYRSAWTKADRILRVNMQDYKHLMSYNESVEFFPNAVSSRFKPLDKQLVREELELKQKEFIFALGIHVKRKGFQDLIIAMKDIKQEKPQLKCYIGGKGPKTKFLKRLIRKHDLSNHVELLGFLSNEMYVKWLNACDLFIFPSHSESFGVTVVEALTCGKPVVATYNNASEFILTENYLGLLVNSRSPTDLAMGIIKALNINWERKKILDFATRFLPAKINEKLLHYYQSILENTQNKK